MPKDVVNQRQVTQNWNNFWHGRVEQFQLDNCWKLKLVLASRHLQLELTMLLFHPSFSLTVDHWGSLPQDDWLCFYWSLVHK